jgi:hypothetical protein
MLNQFGRASEPKQRRNHEDSFDNGDETEVGGDENNPERNLEQSQNKSQPESLVPKYEKENEEQRGIVPIFLFLISIC